MIERAIEKIKAEMGKENNAYVKIIGEYLLKQIEINKNAAEKIVNGDKTIKGSLTEMSKEAKKNQMAGFAILTDAEGFKIVSKYFEFEAVQDKILEVEVNQLKEDHEIEEVKKKEDIDFGVNLDELLS